MQEDSQVICLSESMVPGINLKIFMSKIQTLCLMLKMPDAEGKQMIT